MLVLGFAFVLVGSMFNDQATLAFTKKKMSILQDWGLNLRWSGLRCDQVTLGGYQKK